MVTAFLNVLYAGLQLWTSKEKTKYIDQLIELKEDYYAEYKKDPVYRSDARLDNLLFKMQLVGTGFAAAVGVENFKAQS